MDILQRIFCCQERPPPIMYHARSTGPPPRPPKPFYRQQNISDFTEDPGCKLDIPAIIPTTRITATRSPTIHKHEIFETVDIEAESYMPIHVDLSRPTELSIENPLFQVKEQKTDDWTSIELTTPFKSISSKRTVSPIIGLPPSEVSPGLPYVPVLPRRKTFSYIGESVDSAYPESPIIPSRPLQISQSIDVRLDTIIGRTVPEIPKRAPAINSPADARSQVSPTNEPYAVVKYPFNGSQFDELTSDAGDKLLLKKEVDDQWIYGMNTRTGKFGIIPFSYLDIKVPLAPTSEPKVMAQYAYSSGIEGDLQFQVGDMISVMEWVDDQWLRGKIGSSIGIFPANFVDSKGLTNVPKINKPISPVKFQPTFATATSDTVTAAYDYNSGNPDDLACSAGDVIEVVEKIDENWIRGRLRGVTGMIPVTFLEQSSITQPNLTTFEEKIVTAIADYNSNEEGHLSFSVGDKLIVVEEVDQHWYRGKPEGNIFRFSTPGLIPKSYVN